ncbi:Flavin monooxygenase FMO family and Flavin monooxygenase (FMO) 5 family and Dimethylaniline monooxygenase, N-oxide-forming family and Flavin monooxygenase-like family-containing protein [Strongyloides ratti]|uniref:Flavin-containing monooxygenase n=1 Tax=Strongyloides ratti TaxID=34506 RepID=A0A090MRN1_STRRB|nr:Flavin monooxygenase FMO family and Flavin monooxygenase (FMO) 5 family and Dimethylaniline monooxygenase, N-oxide-forming family and Flavin monooxygenase-like family-containing protein [Strongyloides ratti]CEF60893.1 Flavin monooxygenase FMO family and Flavin monooxygenase (FMO) 5 family and Dimethylaniline monooxygenase, N-oxide-forming family and Flavin monooxygenase-like family-containing protein [Strongyloides ratti]
MNKNNSKIRVCVIGAGVSGLPSIKSCLEEGFSVVCYEKTDELGGLWNYREKNIYDNGMVMKSTIVNTSKEIMSYSDFPPPENYPNFMHNTLVQKYLKDYAKKFDLLKYIKFNTPVKKVELNSNGYNDYDTWKITLFNDKIEIFDKIILCTGHHSKPQYPENIKGMNHFNGKIMHAKEYRDYKGFEDKDIFIIGIGNSALDIAVELAKIAKSVTISTRRGSWIFNRCSQGGMPYDILLMSRLYQKTMNTIPWSVANDFMEHRLQQRMDHDLYGLRPNHRFFQQHPTVNDALANLLLSGMITITEDIDFIEKDGIVVKNGKKFNCDILIFATGYTFSFPYLEPQSIIPINNHVVDLYKYIFPLNYPQLAVIGLIQPIGSIGPISELQSRVACQVFANNIKLPSKEKQIMDIEEKRKIIKRRYFESNKHTIQVDYIPYMDELAEMIGCKPPLKYYFWNDFKFFLRLYIGANVPYVYRLTGPHSWDGAKNAIENVPTRVKKPIKNRECRIRKHKRRGVINEYFRYISMKWIAGYSALILSTGVWVFCFGPTGINLMSYFFSVFIFLFIFSFMLLWFDIQYDMTTIF